MSRERARLYLCDRMACENCAARIEGKRLDNRSVCQYTSKIEHSLSFKLGIPFHAGELFHRVYDLLEIETLDSLGGEKYAQSVRADNSYR